MAEVTTPVLYTARELLAKIKSPDDELNRYSHEKLSYPIHIQEQWLTALDNKLLVIKGLQ